MRSNFRWSKCVFFPCSKCMFCWSKNQLIKRQIICPAIQMKTCSVDPNTFSLMHDVATANFGILVNWTSCFWQVGQNVEIQKLIQHISIIWNTTGHVIKMFLSHENGKKWSRVLIIQNLISQHHLISETLINTLVISWTT